jgi:hypothetical protein
MRVGVLIPGSKTDKGWMDSDSMACSPRRRRSGRSAFLAGERVLELT